MPWTEKQLRLFRAAAHNPEIAKRTGIKQADAERMSKEGLKKAVGGAVKQKILKQDTQHGKMDMPFSKLNRYAGMKEGGLMRSKRDIGKDQMDMAPYRRGGSIKKRFAEGGDVDVTDLETGSSQAAEAASKIPAKTPIVTKEELAASGMSLRDYMNKQRGLTRRKEPVVSRSASGAPRSQEDEDNYISRLSNQNRGRSAGVTKSRTTGGAPNVFERTQSMARGFKQGGAVKESKAMMKKEIGFMKRKGAPASMIRHEEAEAKSEGMKRGGMAKYARGGGIESRGKTKGTMVKMAGGGFVRSADGIASKGKTKGKMC